jgi:hypothetical protein
MRSIKFWSSFVVLCLLCAQPAAQGAKYLIPERIERATETDEAGLLQWAKYEAPKCTSCAGTGKMKCTTCERFQEDSTTCPECHRNEKREIDCRACAGTGVIADPLEQVPCPGCMGASFLLCTVCSGGGRLKVNEAKRWSDCPGCRGEGGFKCDACEGKRVLGSLELKPSLAEAPEDKLKKAMTIVDDALKELDKFSPAGGLKARKELKALCKIFDDAKGVHSGLKQLSKVTKDYLGKVFGGGNFQGHEEHEAASMNMVKESATYYLKHQKRMLELALKRAEANAKVEGK